MRIYVAGRFTEKEMIRAAMNEFEADGHVITFDWTQETEEGIAPEKLREHVVGCAFKDADGVEAADAVIVFPHATGQGLYWETGMAYGLGKPIIVINDDSGDFATVLARYRCIFLYLPRCIHVPDVATARRLLNWDVFKEA